MCDDVIESYDNDGEAKSYDETKTILTISMKRKQPIKCKISIFYLHFY